VGGRRSLGGARATQRRTDGRTDGLAAIGRAPAAAAAARSRPRVSYCLLPPPPPPPPPAPSIRAAAVSLCTPGRRHRRLSTTTRLRPSRGGVASLRRRRRRRRRAPARAPPVAARGSVAVRALINSSPYIGRGGERTGRQGRDRAVSDSAQITRRQRLGGAVLETTDWAPVPVESGKARRDVDDADLSSAGSTRCRYSRPVDAGELRNADDVARCRRRPYLVPPRHVGRAANSTNR